MSELSVTDVQRALQKHAEWGHDVTQHPVESIIRGERYGARLGAILSINSTRDVSTLVSKLMQSESPVISNVASRTSMEHAGIPRGQGIKHDFKELFVSPQYPTVEEDEEENEPIHFFGSGPDWADHERHSHVESQLFTNGVPQHESKKDPRAVHTVLRNIATDKHPYFGIHAKYPKYGQSEVTPIEHGKHHMFDLKKALSKEFPYTPLMSGLIVVRSPMSSPNDPLYGSSHVYDPRTEQLMKIEK